MRRGTDHHLVVEVPTRGEAGGPHHPDHLSLMDLLPLLHQIVLEMGVTGIESIAMADDHVVPPSKGIRLRLHHLAVRGGQTGTA